MRTFSVVQGASRNANLENREIQGVRSSDDPYPEVGFFPHHSGQLTSPDAENNSHVVTENHPHTCHGNYGHMTLEYQSEWYLFELDNSDEIYNQKLLMFKNNSHIII